MRTLFLASLLALSLGLAPRARAGDEVSPERREAIARGLAQGIEALQALGGHDEALADMKRALGQLREGGPRRDEHPELEAVRQQLECYLIAHRVLSAAQKPDLAEIAEHSAHATRLALEGRKDEEAMAVRKSAPLGKARAEALFVAAKILAGKGEQRPADQLLRLGRELSGGDAPAAAAKAAKDAGIRARGEDDEKRALGQRLELLRVALHAAREADRKDAADLLERAVRSGELMLEGREDAEAQLVYSQTPPLPALARLVNQGATFWEEQGHESKAAALRELSAYYAERAKQREAAEGGGDDAERREGEPAARAKTEADVEDQIRALQSELDKLQQALEALEAATRRAR